MLWRRRAAPRTEISPRQLLGNSSGEWRDYYDNLATGFYESIKKYTFGLDDVYTVSPNLLLNFRYGFNRGSDPRAHKSMRRHPGGFFDITTLGLSPDLTSQLNSDLTALPHIVIQGYSGIHDETRNHFQASQVHSVEPSADINRGNHNIKLGFDYRSTFFSTINNSWTMPRYHFACDYTNGPLNTAPGAQGQGMAAFLLGQPSGGFINRADSATAHNNYYGLFIQDNWRLTPRLSFNAGLRWEYFGSVTERFNRSVRGFDFNADSPIAAAATSAYAANPIPEIPEDHFWVKGGLTFAGVRGEPRELYAAPRNLFAPRFGFAYQLGDETVVRGGYGLFHVPIGIFGMQRLSPILTGYNQTTDLVPSFDNGVTFVADIFDPFPSGLLSPSGNSLGLATNLGQSVASSITAVWKSPTASAGP